MALLQLLTIQQSTFLSIVAIFITFVFGFFFFRKTPILSILLIFGSFLLFFYLILYPHITIKKHEDGYNQQIISTNDPKKQLIIDFKLNNLNGNVYVDEYSQDKNCINNNHKRKSLSNSFLVGINLFFIRNKYTKINECSNFLRTNIISCSKLTINECNQLLYKKYYY